MELRFSVWAIDLVSLFVCFKTIQAHACKNQFWNPRRQTQMVLTMSVSSHIQMDFLLLAQKQLFLKTAKLQTSGSAYSSSNPYIVMLSSLVGIPSSLTTGQKNATSFWCSSSLCGLNFRFLTILSSQIISNVSVPKVSNTQHGHHTMLQIQRQVWVQTQYSLLPYMFQLTLKKQTTTRSQAQWTSVFLDRFSMISVNSVFSDGVTLSEDYWVVQHSSENSLW